MSKDSTELMVPGDSAQGGQLRDLRMGLMSLTPENLVVALSQYTELRETFREWLLKQMVRGLHYGTPPGCEPKTKEIDGVTHIGIYNRKENNYRWYPPSQWRVKESLYKAGADFVCDLLAARDEYSADMQAWEQLGKPHGTFVFCCKLYSKLSGEFLGEGRGVRKVGTKGGDENNGIKMAKKCAKVDAVLNTYGLSDLFTQDVEDDDPPPDPPHDNPNHDKSAPKTPPRGSRVVESDLRALIDSWKEMRGRLGLSVEFEQYALFVEGETGMDRAKIKKPAEWGLDDLEKCRRGIDMQLSAYSAPAAPKGDNLFANDGGSTYER